MIWQDVLIGSAQAVFAIALLPAIFHGHHKPPLATSLITSVGMVALLVAFSSLGLWWATVMSSVQFGLWSTLAVQRWRMIAQARQAAAADAGERAGDG